MKRKIEINEYEFDGVKITVEINYCNHTMSIVEYKGGSFENKQFMFSGREKEFSKGWINILDAIKFAVSEATKLLEEDEENHKKEVLEVMERIREIEGESKNNKLNK